MWDDTSNVGSDKILVTDDNDTVTYILTGLIPHSNYSVQVWAETSAGNGTQTTPIEKLITLEDGQ